MSDIDEKLYQSAHEVVADKSPQKQKEEQIASQVIQKDVIKQ